MTDLNGGLRRAYALGISWRAVRATVSVVLSLAMLVSDVTPTLVVAAEAPAPNPVLAQACGLDVALVIDSSGSISNLELNQMKSAFHDFVNTFLPATPTEFSVTDFDTNATVLQGFTSDSNLVNAAINQPKSGGTTNWEQGLAKAQSTFDSRPEVKNLIIFASDGQPNRYATNPVQGSGSGVSTPALNAAIAEANIIKNSGTRILVLGIGTGNNAGFVSNLQSISGPLLNTGATSDVVTTNFSTLAADLAEIATEQCGGTITATKIIDRDGNLQTTLDQSRVPGWNFTIAGQTNQMTDGAGKTPAVTVTGNGPFSVRETVQSGYTFLSARCRNVNHNNVAVGTPGQAVVTGITLSDQDIISCVFYNKPATTQLNIVKVVINDLGGQAVPSDFSFSVHEASDSQENHFETIDPVIGAAAPGTAVTLPGDTYYVVDEHIFGSYFPSFSADCAGTIGVNEIKTCTVTNRQIPEGQGALTVVKVVVNDHGGQKQINDFALTVTDGQTPVSVASGVPKIVSPATYTVSEGGHAGYKSTFGGDCAADGTVVVAAGQSKNCVITNDDIAPEVNVINHVVNSGGGTLTAEDFTTTVTASNPSLASFPGSENGRVVTMDAGSYTIDEIGHSDYVATKSAGCAGTLGIGETATCTITNTFIIPEQTTGSLKVVKVVSGGQATAANFSIHVKTGEGEVSGSPQTGSTLGTTYEALPIGDYVVSETGSPANYVLAFSGDCDSTGRVSLAAGNQQTCTLTNTFQAPNAETGSLVVKLIVSGGSTPPDNFTFVINGGSPISFDVDGQNELTMPIGTYTITAPTVAGYDTSYSNCNAISVTNSDGPVTCTITSTFRVNTGGGGTGSGGGGGYYPFLSGGAIVPPPAVAGAQTSIPFVPPMLTKPAPPAQVLGVTACGIYLLKYIKFGLKNDVQEVKKLQKFLNDHGYGKLVVDGVYGQATRAAVNRFQLDEKIEVLRPWVPHGLKNENTPTGYVYKTTKRRINNIVCPTLNLPMPSLP